ncbi:MAG: LytTR family DNA-binding domain-containing protein [Bacteroidetes bacterium]|nr:LytTR family DNA-binding domain-containing protein [Bacteroidota bacterium]
MEKPSGNIAVSRQTPAEEPFIYIRDNKKVFKVYLKDISYIEGYGEYIKIHAEDKTYLTRKTMHEFEKNYPMINF